LIIILLNFPPIVVVDPVNKLIPVENLLSKVTLSQIEKAWKIIFLGHLYIYKCKRGVQKVLQIDILKIHKALEFNFI